MNDDVIIAGGGPGGLTVALSLHALGIPVQVFESTDELRPLGVGINLLPHAVSELAHLGLLDTLTASGVTPTTLAYFTKRGETIWTEPRGLAAGYPVPQVSIHRGVLQMLLLDAVTQRIGADRVHMGHHLTRFENGADHATGVFRVRATGEEVRVDGRALIAVDGIHSEARKQLYPNEGMPKWNGALLWRGAIEQDPIFDGRTQVWCGHPRQKFVGYPIINLDNGRQLFNFIAELRTDNQVLAEREDWNKPGDLADFLPQFEPWVFDWLDIPEMLRRAPGTYLFPMVDRDPVTQWTDGRVTLLGDAAHPMYPIGSNGASQAILDARVLAGCLRCHPGDVPAALATYAEIRMPATAAVVLANRGFGPEVPMKLVEERAPDGFDSIDDVITPEEILAVTEGYRKTAGFAVSALAEGISLADRDY